MILTHPLLEPTLTVVSISCKVSITQNAGGPTVLAYLDALCSALHSRDADAIAQLLQHPLASALPAIVIDEAKRIAAGEAEEHAAPVQTLRLYHQTAHLLGACSDPATKRRPVVTVRAIGERPRQMELPLLPLQAAVA
jgi:hypothetical protein